MSVQDEYDLANETAALLLRENCGVDPVTIQAHIAHHLAERGYGMGEETRMILRGCMVALNVMHRQIDAMAPLLGLPPYRSEIEGADQ